MLITAESFCEDSVVTAAPGLEKIEILTDVTAIEPGGTFRIGMMFTPSENFHLYWKGPGIVGVAPTLVWDLPKGFTASGVKWPPPSIVDMAGIRANGYKDQVCLITEIKAPGTLIDTKISLKVRCAWMACSTTCHPGLHDFALEIPVAAPQSESTKNPKIATIFDSVLETIPPEAPETWSFAAKRNGKTLTLKATIPDLSFPSESGGIHFFSHDMQIDSDQDQSTKLISKEDGIFEHKMIIPDFSPKNPSSLSGLLYSAAGWPGIESRWVEISIPSPLSSSHE